MKDSQLHQKPPCDYLPLIPDPAIIFILHQIRVTKAVNMNKATHLNHSKLPTKTIMSFWRSRLNKLLRQDILLRRIIIHGNRLSFETQSWDEYWKGIFERTPDVIKRLYKAWCAHRLNGFNKESGQEFGNVYMKAIQEAIINKWSKTAQQHLLSLENTIICRMGSDESLAAMTTNFRNPVLLLRLAGTDENMRYNETLQIPLLATVYNGNAQVFFHYRRQSLLRNINDSLLFFLHVDLDVRGDSFQVLQELVEVLVHEWDSRIEQRTDMLSGKVISPLLPGLKKKGGIIKILDIGSGVGLFTSRLMKHLCQEVESDNHLFDLTLMDQLAVNPERYFREHLLSKSISDLRYINSDYSEGIQNLAYKHTQRITFDLVLFLRILHNISLFTITTVEPKDASHKIGRYEVDGEVSDYFKLLGHIFPNMIQSSLKRVKHGKYCWLPMRSFNKEALTLPNGKSLIDAITRIGRLTIIEDGDLLADILEDHLKSFHLDDIIVYDLSQQLRLSTNHIYILSRKSIEIPLEGEAKWLN